MFSSNNQRFEFSQDINQKRISNLLMLCTQFEPIGAYPMHLKQSNNFINGFNKFQPIIKPNSKASTSIYSNQINDNYKSNQIPRFQTNKSPPTTTQVNYLKEAPKKFTNIDEKLAATGNMFKRRKNWSIISKLPVNKQNTIHIRLEDEGPYGNDETRYFVLSHLSSLGCKDLDCLFCDSKLDIYDRFPLIDGTLFVSPFDYKKNNPIPAKIAGKTQFIYGICIKCLNGSSKKRSEIKCKSCNQLWSQYGKTIQIGTFYKYDIIAANPCCQMRMSCKNCNQATVDLKSGGLPYFSMYSESKQCQHCLNEDFHFIKNLNDIFVKQ